MAKKITFEEYLQEAHMEDYRGCDDNAPDAYAEWVSNLDDSELLDYFWLYTSSDYVEQASMDKIIAFIHNLID